MKPTALYSVFPCRTPSPPWNHTSPLSGKLFPELRNVSQCYNKWNCAITIVNNSDKTVNNCNTTVNYCNNTIAYYTKIPTTGPISKMISSQFNVCVNDIRLLSHLFCSSQSFEFQLQPPFHKEDMQMCHAGPFCGSRKQTDLFHSCARYFWDSLLTLFT